MQSFAALMALSASQTKQVEDTVQSALKLRQQKDEQRRKQQEEIDKKNRELEAKMRLKYFEDQKREQERLKKEQEAKEAKMAILHRRENENRKIILYGFKKAKGLTLGGREGGSKWPTSHSKTREELRRLKQLDDAGDDDDEPGLALTREEKRERKLQAELNRTFNSTKRSNHHGGYGKVGRRLPGGAIDSPTVDTSESRSALQSIKARITATPNTLTKLNIVKRDTRTIDEILQDRAKAKDTKILDGDEAKEFNDWFGKSKKKESPKKAPSTSTPTSGTTTPLSLLSSSKPQSGGSSQTTNTGTMGSSSDSSAPLQKAPKHPVKLLNLYKAPTSGPALPDENQSLKSKSSHSSLKTNVSRQAVSATPRSAEPSRPILGASAKKRLRSPSLSDSPPPRKRRALTPPDNNISNEIWKLFGKDREAYVRRDVLSDDEDMEVGAGFLEREERASYRIAQKEDEEAVKEERRREEEKRRRKKERESRGY